VLNQFWRTTAWFQPAFTGIAMAQTSIDSPSPTFTVSGEGERLALAGALDIRTLVTAKSTLLLQIKQQKTCSLDLASLEELDTTGALFLCGLREQGVELKAVRAEHKNLLDLVCGMQLKTLPKPPATPRLRQLIVQLGKSTDDAVRDTYDILVFIGRSASMTLGALLHPNRLALPSISRHIAETGIYALPIVGLMAILISIVIGYQGVAQLRPYGGEDFTVNLVAVSVLREMAVLITSIMVAGRTGSAFAAEIGVMKAHEEIDALEVMGLEPMNLLVVPRLIALIITLPLLAFYADMMGLLGGAAIGQITLHLSPAQYFDRVHLAVTYKDFAVGLIKAPVFAFFIAIIGCMHGLRVTGSAESVGKETTRAVVKSIFLVIVLDAFFSILFEQLGI
jgi:phospholipid/cholesterol/gamma-HCH transport system permease protein